MILMMKMITITKTLFKRTTLAVVIPLLLFVPFAASAQEPVVLQDEFFRGVVTEVVSEQDSAEFGYFFVQKVAVELRSGPNKGEILELAFETDLSNSAAPRLKNGSHVVVGRQMVGNEQYYISDIYRLGVLWWILLLFVVLVVVLARWYGVRAFAGLLLSFATIVYFIVPFILKGSNPLLISLAGTVALASTALFIAHGFKPRIVIAWVGTVITILLALAASYIFVRLTSLTGLGSEEAFYVVSALEDGINMRWLLLGGIIIGTLGVLDDITTAQAAVVEELHKANKSLRFKQLYKRASSVGREHIVSLVNTLVLAYTGASLPLLLLFEIYKRPTWVTLNSEIIVEEVVRMLSGSVALVLAVPITTTLAAWHFSRKAHKHEKHQ